MAPRHPVVFAPILEPMTTHELTKGEVTRERIRAAAIGLFGDRGFDRVTTREVAAEAGVHQPVIAHYFGDKLGLYESCAQAVIDRYEQHLAPHAVAARADLGGGCPGPGPVSRWAEHQIHAAGDALGNPIRLIGSPGQRNDIAFAHDLVDGFNADATIADKGYDADHLVDRIAQTGTQAVIPPKRNRKVQRPYDADLYKERNIIERFFNKLKQFRRVATRYDKLLVNFMGFVKLAAIAIWLK